MKSSRTPRAFRLALIVAAELALAAPAAAQPRSLTAADQTFVKHLAQGHVADVKLGRLAAQRGSTEVVKAYGQRMAQEHGKLITELNLWAASHQVSMPTSIGAEQRNELKKLQGLSGPQFDREYIRYMVQEHRRVAALLQHGAQQAQDPNVQRHATKALPVLQEHLRAAESIAGQLGIATEPPLQPR